MTTYTEVKGQMVLSTPGQTSITFPLDFDQARADTISDEDCERGISGALVRAFRYFPDLILRGLTSFWGPRVLVWALYDDGRYGQRAASILRTEQSLQLAIGDEQLDEVVVILVPDITTILINSKDHSTKDRALSILRYRGSKSIQAVPGLIYLLKQGEFDLISEEALVAALESITGENFRNNTKRWESWWESR